MRPLKVRVGYGRVIALPEPRNFENMRMYMEIEVELENGETADYAEIVIVGEIKGLIRSRYMELIQQIEESDKEAVKQIKRLNERGLK